MTTWAQFAAIPNGTPIINGGDECVAVANEYHLKVLGGSWVQIWNASEWWTRYSQLPALSTMYKQSQTPTSGAVVVWKPATANGFAGHIGVVLSVNADGSFMTLEQKYGTGSARWTTRFTRRKDTTLYGFLVPNNNLSEEDMPTAQEIANAILDTKITRKGGTQTGTTSLRAVLAYQDALFETIPRGILDVKIPRKGGTQTGETTLRLVTAHTDALFHAVVDKLPPK